MPICRGRACWVLLRRDDFMDMGMSDVVRNLERTRENQLYRLPLQNFLQNTLADEDFHVPTKKKKTDTESGTLGACNAFREQHGLRPRIPKDGKPASELASLALIQALTGQDWEILNIACLYVVKQKGCVPPDFIVGVPQSPSRKSWTWGVFPSLHTHSRLVWDLKLVAFKDLVCAMGWAPPRPSVPPLTSASPLSKVLGNMRCPPVLGAILIGIFTAAQEKKTREGEKCKW